MNKLIKEIELLQQENAALQQMPSGIALQALSKMSQSEIKTMPEARELLMKKDLPFGDCEVCDLNEESWQNGYNAGISAYQALKAECERVSQENEKLGRALLIESSEPNERAQEAAHYNWLDDKNSELKAECKRLKLELDEMTLRFQALQSGFEFEIDKRNLENADLVAELRAALEEIRSEYLYDQYDLQYDPNNNPAFSIANAVLSKYSKMT